MVVNTGAMALGIPRQGGGRVAGFKGPAYSHSNYFTDRDARVALERWMLATRRDGVPGFADPATPTGRGHTRGVAGSKIDGTVLVVPDVMGSTYGRPDRVLAMPGGTERRRPRHLPHHPGGVDTYGPRPSVRRPVRTARTSRPALFLQPNGKLHQAATRLNEAITAAQADDKPVHIVAHGAGCRIVLAADATADRTKSMGHRVLLSPPLQGSAAACARSQGRDALTSALALVSGGEPAQIAAQLDARACDSGAPRPSPSPSPIPFSRRPNGRGTSPSSAVRLTHGQPTQ